jgi:hypothetical protein
MTDASFGAHPDRTIKMARARIFKIKQLASDYRAKRNVISASLQDDQLKPCEIARAIDSNPVHEIS